MFNIKICIQVFFYLMEMTRRSLCRMWTTWLYDNGIDFLLHIVFSEQAFCLTRLFRITACSEHCFRNHKRLYVVERNILGITFCTEEWSMYLMTLEKVLVKIGIGHWCCKMSALFWLFFFVWCDWIFVKWNKRKRNQAQIIRVLSYLSFSLDEWWYLKWQFKNCKSI